MAPKPVSTPPLSPFIRSGNHVYVSGQVPFDGAGQVVGTDVQSQTEQVFNNLENVLLAAGARLTDVVKTTVFLSNVKRDFRGMNDVYARRFGDHRPSRSTVGAELAIDALVEIDAVAIIDGH